MKILITGIQGILGTALKRELRSRGHIVCGLDLKHSDDPREARVDVADYHQLEDAFSVEDYDADGYMHGSFCPDIVYHLAGEFGRLNGDRFPVELWRTNCIGTHNVIEACIQTGACLVFASSSEAYGTLADDEILRESILDTRVPRFHNNYALTKFTNEKQIEIARYRNGLKAVALRFFNVYGEEPYSEYRSVVCRFIYRLLHRQPITVHTGSRDFLYITDWARTVANIARVGRFDSLSEHAYNIGGSESVSIYHLASIVSLACGLRFNDPLIKLTDAENGNVVHKTPDIELARRDLGHGPVVGLGDGIKLTVEWMRKRYNIPE